MKQALKDILKLRRRLNRRPCGLESRVDVKIIEVSDAKTQDEGDGKYDYPETIEVKIENWSNYFFSVRTKDNRWIYEGRPLSGKGYTTAQIYRHMLEELRDHKKSS